MALLVLAGGLALGACSSGSGNGSFMNSGGGTGTTTGGRSGSGGSNGSGGGSGIATGGGPANSGGAPANSGGAGGASSSSGGAAGGATSSSGGAGGAAIVMSDGCGKTAPTPASSIGTSGYGKFTMTVMAQSVLTFNAAMPHGSAPNQAVQRQYYVRLPDGYSPTRPYRVIYLGPGCGQAQDAIMPPTPKRQPPLDTDPNSMGARAGAILVQMEQGTYNPAAYNPANCQIGNMMGCNASSAYCFDDWASEAGTPQVGEIPDGTNGAVAMEKAYFDALHKAVEANYCVDKGRQFFAGYSSGGWLAQQLGCWFPDVLRAQANVTGGIPPIINSMGANYCVNHKIAYMSIHNNPDVSNPFQGSVDGARRVFALNGCTGAFPTPPLPGAAIPTGLAAYTITNAAGMTLVPNSNNFRCYRFTTCPADYPMYFCVSTDQAHLPQESNASPAVWEFFSRF